ncbi:hypothetical protein [Campylobacter upsaliensis]|uniref:hypothetical protein n=1 Tax=Campylobacter upsaliensis TaxID=28080 RepID=UPI002B40EEF2|nr:hypothetical protein [Campylobacter upsaliensis]
MLTKKILVILKKINEVANTEYNKEVVTGIIIDFHNICIEKGVFIPNIYYTRILNCFDYFVKCLLYFDSLRSTPIFTHFTKKKKNDFSNLSLLLLAFLFIITDIFYLTYERFNMQQFSQTLIHGGGGG